jgi:endonuclease G
LQVFAVSVDEVEKQTGLDFFSKLPDDLEERLENKSNAKQVTVY